MGRALTIHAHDTSSLRRAQCHLCATLSLHAAQNPSANARVTKQHTKIACGGRPRTCAPYFLVRSWRAQLPECVHKLCARAPRSSVLLIMCASTCVLARATLIWLRGMSAARLDNGPEHNPWGPAAENISRLLCSHAKYLRSARIRRKTDGGKSKPAMRVHASRDSAFRCTRATDTHCCKGLPSCA